MEYFEITSLDGSSEKLKAPRNKRDVEETAQNHATALLQKYTNPISMALPGDVLLHSTSVR